jgi:hypothetical protein
MFENKIEEKERQLLLGHLNALWSYTHEIKIQRF